MAQNTTTTLPRNVVEDARRVARHRGLPLNAYIAELIAADLKSTFGDAPAPILFIDVDDAGAPKSFTCLSEPHISIPASLAADFAKHVDRVATEGGALAELSDDGHFLRVERHGPAVIVSAGEKRWSLGVHRARQIAREISGKAAMHLPAKVA